MAPPTNDHPDYPVRYAPVKPGRYTRVQLLVRILAFGLLAFIGLPLFWLFAVAFLGLPVFAALRLASRDPEAYLLVDGPRIVTALKWYAAIFGWFGLVTERLPSRSPDETVRVEVEPSGTPTPGTALARLVLGLPSAIALTVLAVAGVFVWIWAAFSVLFREYVGGAFGFLAALQRWSVRLLAYQAALVDAYPPFSLEELPAVLPGEPLSPLPAG